MASKTNFSASEKVLKMYEKRTKDALRLSGELVAGQAKLLCPVDTGLLRGSITYALKNFTSKSDSPASSKESVSKPTDKLTVRIGTNVEYAPEIEFGTSKRKRKSFLRLGLNLSRNGIKQIFGKI